MLIIKNFLSLESCDQIVSTLNKIGWLGQTNEDPEYNRLVKKHLQLSAQDHPEVQKYSSALARAIIDSKLISNFTQPRGINDLQFNCYKEGGSYERHSDQAFLGTHPQILRTDYTVGLILTDGYEGGELSIVSHSGEIENPKMSKGSLICYNCGVMHWLSPVTKGERIIGIGWIESKFRNQQEREIASSVLRLYESLKEEKGLDHPRTQEAGSIYQNLSRYWEGK